LQLMVLGFEIARFRSFKEFLDNMTGRLHSCAFR
jgi:hypothetical protein